MRGWRRWMLVLWIGAAASAASGAGAVDGAITVLARDLQRVDIEDDTRVPDAARPLLLALRVAVRDWAIAQVQADRIPSSVADPLDDTLQGELEAMIPKWSDEDGYRYGTWAGVAIEHVPEHPELVAVQITLNVPYGCDTSLTLLARRDGTWQPVLADQSTSLVEISNAWCDFGYAVSPSDATGDYFVVTANVNPWPTSNWQSLRWHVLRPGPVADQPRLLANETETVFINREPVFDLVATRDDFALAFVTDAGCDVDDGFVEKVRSFLVDRVRAAEIWPAGERVCGFFEDWARAPWSDAASWAHPSASPSVERWHERLKEWSTDADSTFRAEAQPARPCAGGPARMQVQVDLRAGWKQVGTEMQKVAAPGAPPSLFVELWPRDHELHVLDISATPHPGCPTAATGP